MKNQTLRTFRFFFSILALCAMILPMNSFWQVKAFEKNESPIFEQLTPQTERKTVAFEENRGQIDIRVRYLARAGGSSVFLTADEAVYVLPLAKQRDEGEGMRDEFKTEDQRAKTEVRLAFALKLNPTGSALIYSTFVGVMRYGRHPLILGIEALQ